MREQCLTLFFSIRLNGSRIRGLIEEVVALVPEIETADAIGAPDAIVAEDTLLAVGQLVRVEARIAFLGETQMVAVFAFENTFTVDAILGIIPHLTIQAFLVEKTVETEITVHDIGTIVAVDGILIAETATSMAGDQSVKHRPLSEEITLKVYLLPELEWIPIIGIPD